MCRRDQEGSTKTPGVDEVPGLPVRSLQNQERERERIHARSTKTKLKVRGKAGRRGEVEVTLRQDLPLASPMLSIIIPCELTVAPLLMLPFLLLGLTVNLMFIILYELLLFTELHPKKNPTFLISFPEDSAEQF